MIVRARLFVETLSYWTCATGATRGRLYDSVCVRDREGLPYMPGRHLRGLLREAVRQLPDVDADVVSLLFGPRDTDGIAFGSQIRIGSASLVAPVRALLEKMSREERERALFATIQSTAINDATGAALETSLRTYEVVAPTLLEAEISGDGAAFDERGAPQKPCEDWFDIVQRALPLIEGVGAHRARGYGRAIFSVAAYDGEASQ